MCGRRSSLHSHQFINLHRLDTAFHFHRLERDDETTFKRVYFEQDERGGERVRLQPLNSAYASRTVGREEIAGLYAAVSVVRSVGVLGGG